MRHRHLAVDPETPVSRLGAAALDDILERGDLDDWQPVLAEIRRDPWGAVADRVLGLVDGHPMPGTSRLWRSWVESHRRREPYTAVGSRLRALRARRGLTQQQVAARLGMTQPEISRLERRRDLRLGLARDYVAALGGELDVSARFGNETEPVV
jgi:DNA-binding XRE family transcriptional regulator